ncbi:hypothetical protein RUM43_002695 [Polyplax serrata]|uniref:MSP domain-containing protein n=1 Tax=Polyplax serrata TaxID=468196 RepID=A0AAN8PZT4_POLSC
MAKPQQVLLIEPSSELRFRGPFTTPVTSFMKLTNPIDKKVCFKIKTTAPKKYCVRPNSGVLDPNSKVEIAVSLQPFDFDPNEKNKHKFMVLTMIAPEGTSFDNVWQDVNPDCLMDSKLKCVFEMPVENNETAGDSAMEDTLIVQEKLKKSQVKPSFKSTTEFSPELGKVQSDVKNFKMEESSLRQENVELKEEVMRLRLLMQNESETVHPSALGLHENNPSMNRMYIVLAVVMGVFGFLLGKFFF